MSNRSLDGRIAGGAAHRGSTRQPAFSQAFLGPNQPSQGREASEKPSTQGPPTVYTILTVSSVHSTMEGQEKLPAQRRGQP